ncbi:hypothetical protein AAE478_009067 [Parahypoxylon ruwenzoriense]
MTLLALPTELLMQVMEHILDSHDAQALRSAARTCKRLRGIAEVYLYSTAMFTELSSLYRLLDAIRAEPRRREYLRDLRLLYSTQRYDHGQPASPPDLTSFKNLISFASESPECQPRSVRPTHWKVFMDSYIRAFGQASLLNDSVKVSELPLSNLRSLTLHWTGVNERYWNVPAACPIFLIPQLQSLEVSCAKVSEVGSIELSRFQHRTQLKSLVFTECTICIEALHAILSFPTALQRLILEETFHHGTRIDDRFAVEDVDGFNRAISQQSASLEHLQIYCHPEFLRRGGLLNLSLSDFPVLSHLQLGPIVPKRSHRACYALESPIPPRLTSLRLDDYGITMLKEHRVDDVLSSLLVEELLMNAEASSLPFTLDISLQHLPSLLRRIRFNNRDTRPVVRKLAEGLGELFQKYQNVSVHPNNGPSSEQSFDNRASRLRILTNKPRHKIPPFLHDEGPVRYVVRYDSWDSQGFVSEPYPADLVSPDREMSSDDESMDIAFSDASDIDPNFLS